MEDLTLEIVRTWDDTQLLRDGQAKAVTKIRFFLGKHGPFEETLAREHTKFDIEQAIRRRREALAINV